MAKSIAVRDLSGYRGLTIGPVVAADDGKDYVLCHWHTTGDGQECNIVTGESIKNLTIIDNLAALVGEVVDA